MKTHLKIFNEDGHATTDMIYEKRDQHPVELQAGYKALNSSFCLTSVTGVLSGSDLNYGAKKVTFELKKIK